MKSHSVIHWYEGLQFIFEEHPTWWTFRVHHPASDYMHSQYVDLVVPRSPMGGTDLDNLRVRFDISDGMPAWLMPRVAFMLSFLETVKQELHYVFRLNDEGKKHYFESAVDKRKHLWEDPKDKEAKYKELLKEHPEEANSCQCSV